MSCHFRSPPKPRCPQGEPRPLGDIVLAYGVISREAAEQKKPIAHHVTHLIVHGALHLLGYDHETDRRGRSHGGPRNYDTWQDWELKIRTHHE